MSILKKLSRDFSEYTNSVHRQKEDIQHITKVDPEKVEDNGGLSETDLESLHFTDALMVSGSDGVTTENTYSTVKQLAGLDKPIIQEPYQSEHVSREVLEEIDYIGVPIVWNAGDTEWILDRHTEFFGEKMAGLRQEVDEEVEDSLSTHPDFLQETGKGYAQGKVDATLFNQAYIVQNPEAEVGKLTNVLEPMSSKDVGNVANTLNEYYDNFDTLYIEYSGKFGEPEDVEKASERLEDRFWLVYGGGITDWQKAKTMLDAGADTIVVGDKFHENPNEFIDTCPGYHESY